MIEDSFPLLKTHLQLGLPEDACLRLGVGQFGLE